MRMGGGYSANHVSKAMFSERLHSEQTPECGAGWCGDKKPAETLPGVPLLAAQTMGHADPSELPSCGQLGLAVSHPTVKPRRTPSPGYIRVEELLTSGHAGSADGHRTAQCPSRLPEHQFLSTVGRPLLAIASTRDLDCCHCRRSQGKQHLTSTLLHSNWGARHTCCLPRGARPQVRGVESEGHTPTGDPTEVAGSGAHRPLWLGAPTVTGAGGFGSAWPLCPRARSLPFSEPP